MLNLVVAVLRDRLLLLSLLVKVKVKVKVTLRVKEDHEGGDKTGTLRGRCQPACTRDTVSTRRASSQPR